MHPVEDCVKVKVASPAENPVTTPAFVTEATAGLLLTQVPPDVGDKVVVAFIQMEETPEILTEGGAFTVTAEVVLLHPVEVWVNVKVAVPPNNPVTNPALVTEAIVGLLLTHVPPVVGDKEVVAFMQMEETPVMLMVGKSFTVTAEVVLLHPVDVRVKVKVAAPAETPETTPAFVTIATAVLLLTQVPPVVGDNVVVEFKQIEETPVILTVGKAFTVTTGVELLHPVEV